MYLKKIDGPRAVKLPDGRIMTRADLPEPDTRRWVASRKAAVVNAVLYGLLTRDKALVTYGLSGEELDEWIASAKTHGPEALKTTYIQKYRHT